MSNQITTNFVQQFKETLYHLVQQKGSRLREHVTVEMVTGEHAYFDQIGATRSRRTDCQRDRTQFPHVSAAFMNLRSCRRRQARTRAKAVASRMHASRCAGDAPVRRVPAENHVVGRRRARPHRED